MILTVLCRKLNMVKWIVPNIKDNHCQKPNRLGRNFKKPNSLQVELTWKLHGEIYERAKDSLYRTVEVCCRKYMSLTYHLKFCLKQFLLNDSARYSVITHTPHTPMLYNAIHSYKDQKMSSIAIFSGYVQGLHRASLTPPQWGTLEKVVDRS